MAEGPLAGYQIVGCQMCLDDGSFHAVDSSEMAFRTCARDAFNQAFRRAKPCLLEPVMAVEVWNIRGLSSATSTAGAELSWARKTAKTIPSSERKYPWLTCSATPPSSAACPKAWLPSPWKWDGTPKCQTPSLRR